MKGLKGSGWRPFAKTFMYRTGISVMHKPCIEIPSSCNKFSFTSTKNKIKNVTRLRARASERRQRYGLCRASSVLDNVSISENQRFRAVKLPTTVI